MLFTARGRNWYRCTSSRCYTDFAGATITRDIVIPGPTRPGLSHAGKTHNILQTHTWHDQIVTIMLPTSQSELALPSTGSWLPSRVPLDAEQSA